MLACIGVFLLCVCMIRTTSSTTLIPIAWNLVDDCFFLPNKRSGSDDFAESEKLTRKKNKKTATEQ